ncbi:MAG: hypothetical protein ACXW5W_17460 [Candidatus Binatia bacterium]
MPYIKAVAPGEATGKLKEIYEDGSSNRRCHGLPARRRLRHRPK